jgi:tripeptidyl-peptidase I
MLVLSYSVLLTAAALTAARAVPDSYQVHERREVEHSKWIKRDRIAPHITLPVRVGLKQNSHAAENAHSWLMDVSHPGSAKYGQHWYEHK